jgi:hypothetical protein
MTWAGTEGHDLDLEFWRAEYAYDDSVMGVLRARWFYLWPYLLFLLFVVFYC